MRTQNTFGIQFITRLNRAKNDQLPIYVRITVDRQRVEVSLKRYISKNSWNSERGIAKNNSAELRKLNTYLEQVRSQITEYYQQLVLKKQLVTAEAIKNLYCGVVEQEHSLLSVFDYHNTVMNNSLEWGTLKNYFTTRRYVEEFIKQHLKTSDIFLTQLNYKFLADFERFMKTYVQTSQKTVCGQNTIMKHIERLRKVVNLAIKNDWLDRDPFTKFTPSFIRTERQFLTAEELATIEEKTFKVPRLEIVKDLFNFSCYTGLAYIDVFELNPSNISLGIDGNLWIITKRHKTDISVHIPLLPNALEIIEKYKNHPRTSSENKLLPVFTNQIMNGYLKEIADLCNITKPLTFHIARHTFATTVTLTNGVPIETVSKLLGHTSIKTTQIYAKVIEQKLSDDMMILKDKLSSKTLKISKSV